LNYQFYYKMKLTIAKLAVIALLLDGSSAIKQLKNNQELAVVTSELNTSSFLAARVDAINEGMN